MKSHLFESRWFKPQCLKGQLLSKVGSLYHLPSAFKTTTSLWAFPVTFYGPILISPLIVFKCTNPVVEAATIYK